MGRQGPGNNMDVTWNLKHKLSASDEELSELAARHGELERYNSIALTQMLILLRLEKITKRLDGLDVKVQAEKHNP